MRHGHLQRPVQHAFQQPRGVSQMQAQVHRDTYVQETYMKVI